MFSHTPRWKNIGLENVGSSTSHSPIDLQGLVQGELCFFYLYFSLNKRLLLWAHLTRGVFWVALIPPSQCGPSYGCYFLHCPISWIPFTHKFWKVKIYIEWDQLLIIGPTESKISSYNLWRKTDFDPQNAFEETEGAWHVKNLFMAT
jgi:hypothetical protein